MQLLTVLIVALVSTLLTGIIFKFLDNFRMASVLMCAVLLLTVPIIGVALTYYTPERVELAMRPVEGFVDGGFTVSDIGQSFKYWVETVTELGQTESLQN